MSTGGIIVGARKGVGDRAPFTGPSLPKSSADVREALSEAASMLFARPLSSHVHAIQNARPAEGRAPPADVERVIR